MEYIIRINDNDVVDADGNKRIVEMHELIRCKDCKWRNTKACFCVSPKDVLSDWFCSEAERKTGDEGS